MKSSAFSPSFIATTKLAQSVFQLCGVYGMSPYSAVVSEDFLGLARAVMPDPMQFSTAKDYAQAYLAWNLLRKFDSFPVDIDRRAVASDGFNNSEVACGQINREVDALPYVPGVLLSCQQQSIVEHARRLVHQALGRFDLEEFQMSCAFSGGASTRVPRKRGAAAFKLAGKPHVTINCRDLAVHFIWCNELWRKTCQDTFGRESDPYSWVQLVPGSRFETVPKDSLKDRPICIEPDLNMFFQKGIGKMIRRRLKRRGIDLDDQRINQSKALMGSIDGSLATIDLSSASDSVSLRVCEMLLPDSWYNMMLTTRSAYVLKDGKYVRLEKMSSMGNGFTFELESLIFWALARASTLAYECDPEHLTVYGDDIIVPTRAAYPLISVLQSLGFKTNTQKTFVTGPFRESCGKHYFLGSDVSPLKIEHSIESWADLYHLCNQVAEWGWADPREVDNFVSRALKPIPPRNRCRVPMSFGSRTGLRVQQGRMSYCKRTGSAKYKVKYLAEVTKTHDMSGPYAYLSGMLQAEQSTPSLSGLFVRDPAELQRDITFLEAPLERSRSTSVETGNYVVKTTWVLDWCDVVA